MPIGNAFITPLGPRFLVNTTTANDQYEPSIATLADGRMIVTWTNQNGSYSVYGQILNADGTKSGSEFVVSAGGGNHQAYNSQVTALSDGRFVVTWTDQNANTDVHAQIYNADGTLSGSEFTVNTNVVGTQRIPDITELSNGNILVAWESGAGPQSIHAQVFNAAGAKVGGEITVDLASFAGNANVAALGSGGFVVTWDKIAGNLISVAAQVYAANGTKVGSEILVNEHQQNPYPSSSDIYNQASESDVVALNGGRFVVTWQNRSELYPTGPLGDASIRAQIFEADGTKVGSEMRLTAPTGPVIENPAIAALDDGGFVVSWNGASSGVWAQTYDADGYSTNDVFTVTNAPYIDKPADITTLAGGKLVFGWGDSNGGPGDNSGVAVVAQRFDITGNAHSRTGNDLQGSNDADTLVAGSGNDSVSGGNGADVILGNGGNDRLDGGNGLDLLLGGAGDDTLLGGAYRDTLHGEAGNDLLRGEDGADALYGGAGDDTLEGGAGNDYAEGGVGRDLAYLGTGDDYFYGGELEEYLPGTEGRDTVYAGAGRDSVHGSRGSDLIFGEDGGDQLYGDEGADTLTGGLGDDWLSGGVGNDRAFGNQGADTLLGGGGNDKLDGGVDNDSVSGGVDNDSVSGGAGADTVIGGSGHDTLRGGDGDDRVIGGDGKDSVWMGTGDDLFIDNGQAGSNGADTVRAGAGNDTIGGGGGNDRFEGQDGNDRILGRLGSDKLFGGGQNDTLVGGDGADTVAGGNGRDRAFLGNGNDQWFDNAQVSFGDDFVVGGGGADTIRAGGGDDTLAGGTGADTFIFAAAIDADVITDYELGTDRLRIASAVWNGPLTQAHLDALASVVGPDLVLDFGGGDSLTLEGLTSTAGLLADIALI